MPNCAQAQSKRKTLLIDGIAVLAGGQAANETESTRILLSDLQFESVLLLLRRGNPIPQNRIRDARIWLVAQRSAVLIRVLANQARQFQETVDSAEASAVKRILIERAGGNENMESLLGRFGMAERHLDAWVENALLAETQIRYVREQVDTPSDKEIKVRMLTGSEAGTPEEKQEAYENTRKRIVEERMETTFEVWMKQLLKEGRIRIVQ